MIRVIRCVIAKLDDIQTLHYISSLLPFRTPRAAHFRCAFAFCVLTSFIDRSVSEEQLEQDLSKGKVQVLLNLFGSFQFFSVYLSFFVIL